MMKKRILLILSLIFVMAGLGAAQQTARKKTVTNDDLEKYRQARLKSEAEYRANYKKLGMPSPEELEKQEADRRAWHAEYSKKVTAQTEQTENYFQSQANQLRAEIINVQAQINYLQGQIAGLPNRNSVFLSPNQVYSVGVLPYGYYRRNGSQTSAVNQASNVQTAINAAAAAPNPYYGTSSYPTGIKATIGATNPVGRRGFGRVPIYGGYTAVAPYSVNNNSYERDELVSRLRYLEQVKAGLLAQFEALREEARRAGVKID